MDERELKELFRQAAGEAPPPTFSASDVAAESRRVTRRRRNTIAGVACAVVLLGGGAGAVGVLLGNGSESNTTAASAPGQEGADEQPGASSGRPPQAQVFPNTVPKQGGAVEGESTLGCDTVDRELATALAGELPAGADAVAGGGDCPDGPHSATYSVEGGTITAVFAPRGLAFQLPEQPEGAEFEQRPTASGGTVYVLATPDSASRTPPLSTELGRIADALARHF
ncbi:hypothetical protein BAY59_03365 [Prauserella coralliicola]|nr:hypothetical protein BAY59_03365 [Prauserella coralliicola]